MLTYDNIFLPSVKVIATTNISFFLLTCETFSLEHLSLRRITFLQSAVAEHQQFDELLLSFSVWIKLFLGELQTTSEISITDQQAAFTRHKVKGKL